MSKKKKLSNQKSDSNPQKCTLYVDGMHCSSCEILVEKKLLKHEGVETVEASLKDSTIQILANDKSDIDIDELNKEFKDLGYKFSDKKFKYKKESPLISTDSKGQLRVNPKKLTKLFGTLGILFVIGIGVLILNGLEVGRFLGETNKLSMFGAIVLGLIAGVSSCAALVGGILLSMTKQWNETYITEESSLKKFTPHFLFHSGRILGFVIAGFVLGLIGLLLKSSFEDISRGYIYFNSIIILIVSVLMIILALQMLEIKWAQKITFSSPKKARRIAADESKFKGKYAPFLLGFSTIILACGFTIIAYTAAFNSGNPVAGAGIGLGFALGTMIPLLVISLTSVKLNSKPHLTAKFNQVAGILIIIFAVYTINSQLNVLGLTSLNDIKLPSGGEEIEGEVPVAPEGEQKMTVTAQNFEYIPTSSMTIKAGVPTVLEVNNKGVQGCGAFMAARGLFPGYVSLKMGLNEIEFTPKKGTYKLTCSMGMVPPVTITVT